MDLNAADSYVFEDADDCFSEWFLIFHVLYMFCLYIVKKLCFGFI